MEQTIEKTKQQEQIDTKEVLQEMKDFKEIQNSVENDELIIKHIVDGIVKKHATREARLLEIEKMEIENNKEIRRIAEENKKRQIECQYKEEIVKIVFDGIKWIGVSVIAGAVIVITQNKEIEKEKIRQGL